MMRNMVKTYGCFPLRALLPLFSFCLLAGGCTADGEESPFPEQSAPLRSVLRASGHISTLSSSRVTDAGWEGGDRMGIFMLHSGGVLSEEHIAEGAFNRSYTHRADGEFSPSAAADTIWFPRDAERKVDFIAYYPYSAGVGDDAGRRPTLSVDLSKAQTDYLYAPRVSGFDRNTPEVSFTFHHLLSRVEVELVAGKGMEAADLSGASVRITGIPVSATCLLADGSLTVDPASRGTLPLTSGTVAETGYLSTFLLPSAAEGEAGRSLVITLPGREDEPVWSIPADKVFRAGERTVYHITLNKKEVKPDPDPDPTPDPDPDPDPDPNPDPDPKPDTPVELVVTSRITDWTPGNGSGESGSAE